jgi:hypothetical protein
MCEPPETGKNQPKRGRLAKHGFAPTWLRAVRGNLQSFALDCGEEKNAAKKAVGE